MSNLNIHQISPQRNGPTSIVRDVISGIYSSPPSCLLKFTNILSFKSFLCNALSHSHPSWPPACPWGATPWAASPPSPVILWWTLAVLALVLPCLLQLPARWAVQLLSVRISMAQWACSSMDCMATAPMKRKLCRVSTAVWPTTWTRSDTLQAVRLLISSQMGDVYMSVWHPLSKEMILVAASWTHFDHYTVAFFFFCPPGAVTWTFQCRPGDENQTVDARPHSQRSWPWFHDGPSSCCWAGGRRWWNVQLHKQDRFNKTSSLKQPDCKFRVL